MLTWEEVSGEVTKELDDCKASLAKEQIESERIQKAIESDPDNFNIVIDLIANEEKIEFYSTKIEEIDEIASHLEDIYFQLEHIDDENEKRLVEVEIEDLCDELGARIHERYYEE